MFKKKLTQKTQIKQEITSFIKQRIKQTACSDVKPVKYVATKVNLRAQNGYF